MASAYGTATKRMQDDPSKPFNRREYRLALLNPEKAQFDVSHATMDAVVGEEGNEPIDRVALKTQIIKDPTRPISASSLLQFFIVNPNKNSVIRNRRSVGVIYEIDGSKEIPLFKLNADEVWEMSHGNGYNAQVLTPAIPAAAS